jgi:hypothetical protein
MSTKLIILSVNSIDDLSDSLYIDPVTKSTAKETEVFSNVMLSKAADRALAHGRDKITKNDIDEIALVCVPVVWPCIRSTIIENPSTSAITYAIGDARRLELIGITTNQQLIQTPVEEIVEKTISSMREKVPDISIGKSERNVLLKRAQLWKEEANMLSRIQVDLGPERVQSPEEAGRHLEK